MFYYLGRKKRLAGLYPEPLFDTIIEPFCGSAAYSLHGDRWKRNVIINDINPGAVVVWNYLLNARPSDILQLPDFEPGDNVSDVKSLSDAERQLIAYHINPGSRQNKLPLKIVTKFSRWSAGKKYIAANLHKIKHWKLIVGDYRELDNVPATWFIDPPYNATQSYYLHGNIDFVALADWCMTRNGQVIVCEQSGANWLPFVDLATIDICGKSKTKEVVFIR